MTPKVALEKREQMIREGYCVIENILTEEFLQELHDESERYIAGHKRSERVKYHGCHILVKGDENDYIQKLMEWQPTRKSLNEIGFGDFAAIGGVIILAKEPKGAPLYWHQD